MRRRLVASVNSRSSPELYGGAERSRLPACLARFSLSKNDQSAAAAEDASWNLERL